MSLLPVTIHCRSISRWLIVSVLALGCFEPARADEEAAFFTEKIEPILRERCYECHSHEGGKTKGGLTLDSRSGWSEGGSSGPAVVPGKPAESLLVNAARRLDPDTAMPPKKPLPQAEVELLTEWVKRGATDPRVTGLASKPTNDWWSLKPLAKSDELRGPISAEMAIDTFTRRKLEEHGLTPSPPADRRTLIRRIYFDLHGLAPEPEDVAEFCNDPDPLAYEKLVDRLLASPRYGERWARHWLDTIHFADTHGFEHDEIRAHAWRYRDYVIQALNADTPWPRFIREQLAADVFFPDQPQLTAALGFIGAGPFDLSAAGTAPKMFELVDRDDMLVQTMAAFTSTTAGCARCHDHKFDPISQQEYYSLAAVFAGVTKGDLSYDENPNTRQARARWERLAAAAAKKDAAVLLGVEAQQLAKEWESSLGSAPRWEVARLQESVSAGGATLEAREDGSVVSSGTRPDKETVSLRFALGALKIAALRLEVMADPALPKGGPGRQDNGNLHLSECEVYVDEAAGTTPQRVAIARASADFNQQDWTIAHAIDGNEQTAWGIYPRVGETHTAVFALREAIALKPGATMRVVLKQVHGAGHIIGRLRLAVTDSPSADAAIVPAAVAEVLALPPAERSEAARLELAAQAVAARAAAGLAALPAPAKVYAAGTSVTRKDVKVSVAQPTMVHVLSRGELSKPGEVAAPGALECVPGLKARFELPAAHPEAARRAALADWIADNRNSLTWRSIVNRVWHYHFGRGLSDTPNDLGRMGGLPSHPELLDWLAADFRDRGGSLKRLHRLIVTSAIYRQSSAEDTQPKAQSIDGDNRWLWRANRLRLDAEAFRDIVMQKAGQLDLTMGGPAVMHFKLGPPVQNTPTLDYTGFRWDQPGVNRRSIYRFVFRNIADPFMVSLDFPDAAQLAPTRPFSASALQALALWNDNFVLHFSQQLAARLEKAAATSGERARALAQLLFVRAPGADEELALAAYAEKHGLAALCRVLLNSSEFLFVN